VNASSVVNTCAGAKSSGQQAAATAAAAAAAAEEAEGAKRKRKRVRKKKGKGAAEGDDDGGDGGGEQEEGDSRAAAAASALPSNLSTLASADTVSLCLLCDCADETTASAVCLCAARMCKFSSLTSVVYAARRCLNVGDACDITVSNDQDHTCRPCRSIHSYCSHVTIHTAHTSQH
jgi:hypothetical protein